MKPAFELTDEHVIGTLLAKAAKEQLDKHSEFINIVYNLKGRGDKSLFRAAKKADPEAAKAFEKIHIDFHDSQYIMFHVKEEAKDAEKLVRGAAAEIFARLGVASIDDSAIEDNMKELIATGYVYHVNFKIV